MNIEVLKLKRCSRHVEMVAELALLACAVSAESGHARWTGCSDICYKIDSYLGPKTVNKRGFP